MWRHRRRRVDVYLRGTVGHPADLISRLSRQLASASHSGSLHFSGADLIEAAISLAGVSSLLTTSIADANISEAKERDDRIAAGVGLIDTLAGLVPLPGAKAVGSEFSAPLVKTTYNELVDRGSKLLETNHEGAPRADADAFDDALLFSYAELLTLGHLGSQGAGALASSIDEFFAASPHLDRGMYDFPDGAGVLLTDLSDRQTQAYGEWITFASGSPEINDAISRMLAEFLQGLRHHDD